MERISPTLQLLKPTRPAPRPDLVNLPAASTTPETCERCRGAGFYTLDVPVGDPQFGKLQTCDCTKHRQRQREHEQIRTESGLDVFADKTFDTFNPRMPGIEAAYRFARGFAQKPQGSLMFTGEPGCGKTHLSKAIGNALTLAGHVVLFMTAPDLLRKLRATFDDDSKTKFDALFERYLKAPVFILDDLGVENKTDWAQETIFTLLNERYEYGFPTVVSSNINPDSPEGLKRFGKRLTSRLLDQGQCRLIQIVAVDYRRLPLTQRLGA